MMATSGGVDDGREIAPANAAQRADGEAPAGHVGWPSLPSRFARSPISCEIWDDALLVGVVG